MLAKKRLGCALLALATVLFPAEAFANGVTTPDSASPPPIKKSVRKVKAPRPKRTSRKVAPKKTATKAAPKPAPVSALDQGVALMKQERYTAARPWLQKAVQQNRRSAAAWYWYGMYHEKTGHFYEAQYFYSKAVECDPTFEPLSRVVTYPNGGGKTPLWDPRRPARVYPVPTDSIMGKSGGSVAVVPPDAPQSQPRPSRPANDPELPKVPAYIPPEPGALPQDGDAWHPAVYVPPTMGSVVHDRDEETPVYIPPSVPQGTPGALSVNTSPVYQPPQPVPQTVVSQPAGKETSSPSPAPRKAAAKPTPTKKTTKKAPARRAASKKPAAAPSQPAKAPEPPTPKVETPPAPPARPETPPTRSLEYLPPVGQVPQDGVESVPLPRAGEGALPPVGQGEPVRKPDSTRQIEPSEGEKSNA